MHTRTVLPLVALAAAAAMSPLPAEAGNASRATAHALADGLIEVVADFSENALYWCGAALFVSRNTGAASADRIHVWAAPGPSIARPGEIAVRFGLTAPPETPATGIRTTDVDLVGNSMSLAQARQTCNERSVSQ